MTADPTTAAPAQGQTRNDKKAVGFMLLAAAGYSVMPLAVVLLGAKDFPLLFGAVWRGGIAIVYAVFLAIVFREILFDREVMEAVRRRILHWKILLATVAYLDVALFAMSIRYLEVPTATILFVISPLFRVFYKWAFRKDLRDLDTLESDGEEGKIEINKSVIAFFLMGIFAVVFVVLSQVIADERLSEVEWNRLGSIASNPDAQHFALGLLLAVAAVIISSLNMFGIQWRDEVEGDLSDAVKGKYASQPVKVDMFFSLLIALIASIAIIPLSGGIGLISVGAGGDVFGSVVGVTSRLFLESGAFDAKMLIVIAVGALIFAGGGIAIRKANAISDNPGINGVEQLSPVFSLMGLWLLGTWAVILDLFPHLEPDLFSGVKEDYLVIGTAAIITANILINFEGEVRAGFKALLIGLGACGAIVYLREDVYEFLNIPGAGATATGDYLGWVALAATIFTLLLAFRVATTVSRTSAEEAYAFSALRKMEALVEREVIDAKVLEQIAIMDSPQNNAQLKDAYQNTSRIIAETKTPEDALDRELLATAEAEIDTLARSKQLRLVLGELFALNIFAGITIAFALLLRPDIGGELTTLLNDLFAMLISGVVIFLTVHIWDLHHERARRQLRENRETGRYELQFGDVDQRVSDVWISVIAGVAIVATYTLLLADKWLDLGQVMSAFGGWFG